MPFAASSFGQLRYIPEVTPNVVPVAGNGINLRMTSPTLKAAISTVKSQEIRPDRLSTGQTPADLNIDGGFNFELSGKEYDPFLEGVLLSSFAHHGTNGLGTTFSMATAATTITAAVAPTTTSAFTTLAQGSWFKVVPPVGASQAIKDYFADKWLKVSSSVAPTATVITLDANTPLSGVGLMASTAGYAITQSTVSNGLTPKSFTLEYAMTDIVQFLTFTGMRSNTLEMSLEVGSIITGSFGFLGSGHSGQATTRLPGSPVASKTLDVMNSVTDVGAIYEGGASILTGSSFIKSIKFNINNSARGQKAIGVFGNAGVGWGELELGGTIEMYVENLSYYLKWLTGASTSLALGMADAAGNGYMLEFDNVQFSDGGLNAGGRNDDTMLSLPFSAFYSPATGRGVRITRAIAAA